ncbi:type II restriction enzyme [Candidatus Magnetomorum sp. HK-1]|nr:type II restriction enzyme [Candidatus Magnetomorum sp. HK-1]
MSNNQSTTPSLLTELVDRFRFNIDSYKNGHYNETQVRKEFIDPFFEVMGWDVSNKKGYAEAYKDVIHEDAIKIGGATKAPDYSFRIGGKRIFFLEAKKPSINIKNAIHPAYQLRRYAWTAKLPLSILTDFEEFAVYDCRVQPVKTDQASHSRILYLTYDQSPDQLTPDLNIDDRPLKEIFKQLYYPDCPYEFSVLPSDILGQVYEKFLGKVIRLTSKNKVVLEDKPEVRKAGGVFYTPTYIVTFIVQQTIETCIRIGL